MTRHVTNWRPKGDPNAMPYSVQRDLANIYTPMLREVFAGFDEPNWPDYFKSWAETAGVTEDDCGRGVQCFVEAHRLFVRDRTIGSPHAAFEKAGFFDLPRPVQVLLFERLGMVVAGGFFIALRDVTMEGQLRDPQGQADFCDMVAAGRVLAGVLSLHRPRELDEEQLTIERAKSLVEETKRAYDQLHKRHEDLRRDVYQTTSERDALQCQVRDMRALHEPVTQLLKRGFWSRLWGFLKLAWAGQKQQE